ncbi:NAD(P)/FAD-dependent oxidoreductase [Cohaesibacter celericrescens]|uniref:Amino acid dehydrogenase n=1 Tax=Cohaesibacter celericrescens TaxID=2067669 RepID=A0A2N5XNB2_9HYPH|nr:FAD-dependent oxidoreductase [Cohaesibacter celericrescens]PLW75930.1 amino acid dehydrogenase [Cohaesibacter celericrescens]
MAEFLVLGAGVVGVSTGLALQQRGHSVTILDRLDPGLETSYGNAGIIQREAVEPYAIPQDLPTLIRYGLGRTNDIVYHVRDLPQVFPALWSYFRHSSPRRHAAISNIYAQITARVTDDHAPLIQAANAEHLLRRNGFFTICRDDAAMEKESREAERLKSTYDVALRVISGNDVKREEPAIMADIAGAIHWSDAWSTTSPGDLTAAYAKLFTDRGGRLVKGDALSLKQVATGWTVDSGEHPVTASQVVVALGPWSPDLLKLFGYHVPMVWKRGYHQQYRMAVPLSRPIHDFANGAVYSSMIDGLRIVTGAELVRREGPNNLKQLKHALKSARELMAVGEATNTVWSGNRPCLPDMLPLVGAAPRHKGLWFHFGHGHQGLSMGPTTAHLLADAIDGNPDPLMTSLSPENRSIVS